MLRRSLVLTVAISAGPDAMQTGPANDRMYVGDATRKEPYTEMMYPGATAAVITAA
jgi:hypothetical protein